MILIESLYQTLQDLMRKDHAGYHSSDEFNRLVNQAQLHLMQYYVAHDDGNRIISEALAPFSKEEYLVASVAGYYDLPDDYYQRKDIGYEVVTNTSSGAVATLVPVDYLEGNEVLLVNSSPIRQPRVNRADTYACTRIGNQLKLLPSSLSGRIYLLYYKTPPDAERAYTVDVGAIEEVYDDANSTNLEWAQSQYEDFVDLMLAYKGLSIRESILVQWVQQKKMSGVPEELQTVSP